MMNCPHTKIESALDRWSECHWHIHQMEVNYHTPDSFRYSFNSFVRAIKEIPQILNMELQNDPRYQATFKPVISSLKKNDLFSLLHETRDFIVHRGMLEVLSSGIVGTTEGKSVKIASGFHVAPYETTLEAYERFKEKCRCDKIIRGWLGPDCDSKPFIRREWKIPDIPDRDLLELAIEAWRLVGEVLSSIVINLGGEALDLSFSCGHDPEKIKVQEFSQAEFFQSVDGVDINT
jgi:hypothetical protein